MNAGLIRGWIAMMDGPMKFMFFFLLFALVALTVAHPFMKEKREKWWTVLCVVPFLVFLLFCALQFIKGDVILTASRLAGCGLAAFFIALWGFDVARKNEFVPYTILTYVITLGCLALTLLVLWKVVERPYVANYSRKGWATSFEKTIDQLEKTYALRDWKDVDFQALKSKLLPKVTEAEKKKDAVGFAMALCELNYELHDGNAWVEIKDANVKAAVAGRLAGNDYGLSLIRDEGGCYRAILVDEKGDAYYEGIEDGTVITKWDGEPVRDAAAKVKCMDTEWAFPCAENEAIFQPIFLAGQGGDQVSVAFLDENGQEQTAVLEKMGSYLSRRNAAIQKAYGDNLFCNDNFYACMLDKTVGYLRITKESYGGGAVGVAKDNLAGYSKELYEGLSKALKSLKSRGMDRLILDLRGNSGGDGYVYRTVAALFTEDELMPDYARYKKGEFKTIGKAIQIGEHEWSELLLVVLVNGETKGNGECMASVLAKKDNAYLAGNMTASGSGQAVDGACIMTYSGLVLHYPILVAVDADGQPMVDVGASRKSSLTLDYRITFDEEELMEYFGAPESDMVLDATLEYIKGM